MKNKEQIISYTEQVWFQKTLYGILLIAAGAIGVFPNDVCNLISTILTLVGLYVIYNKVYANPRREKQDEMAEANMLRAESDAQARVRLISLSLMIVLMIVPGEWTVSLNWKSILSSLVFIILGVQDVLTGVFFKRLEEE